MSEAEVIEFARMKANETQQWYEVWYANSQYVIATIHECEVLFSPAIGKIHSARFIQSIAPVLNIPKKELDANK
jgi:hypothetical protein